MPAGAPNSVLKCRSQEVLRPVLFRRSAPCARGFRRGERFRAQPDRGLPCRKESRRESMKRKVASSMEKQAVITRRPARYQANSGLR